MGFKSPDKLSLDACWVDTEVHVLGNGTRVVAAYVFEFEGGLVTRGDFEYPKFVLMYAQMAYAHKEMASSMANMNVLGAVDAEGLQPDGSCAESVLALFSFLRHCGQSHCTCAGDVYDQLWQPLGCYRDLIMEVVWLRCYDLMLQFFLLLLDVGMVLAYLRGHGCQVCKMPLWGRLEVQIVAAFLAFQPVGAGAVFSQTGSDPEQRGRLVAGGLVCAVFCGIALYCCVQRGVGQIPNSSGGHDPVQFGHRDLPIDGRVDPTGRVRILIRVDYDPFCTAVVPRGISFQRLLDECGRHFDWEFELTAYLHQGRLEFHWSHNNVFECLLIADSLPLSSFATNKKM